uniref:Uncharacterized protein n=1 Tax=viral metagenome TaxID=1070528 RepID=A0A6C0HQ21_9ZZZZ
MQVINKMIYSNDINILNKIENNIKIIQLQVS